MSIDARIDLVTYESDGTSTLWLVDRDSQSIAGQRQLTVVNPRPHMETMEGMCIWGSASTIGCPPHASQPSLGGLWDETIEDVEALADYLKRAKEMFPGIENRSMLYPKLKHVVEKNR